MRNHRNIVNLGLVVSKSRRAYTIAEELTTFTAQKAYKNGVIILHRKFSIYQCSEYYAIKQNFVVGSYYCNRHSAEGGIGKAFYQNFVIWKADLKKMK
ncbi:hypothetical protein HYS94_02175 [Candidatus Daviesbacteria bacterium]|nr:hypothetical protein [Candidatus Daviesbacteria bacterium]